MADKILTNRQISKMEAVQVEIRSIPGRIDHVNNSFRYVARENVMRIWGEDPAGKSVIDGLTKLAENLDRIKAAVQNEISIVDDLIATSRANNSRVDN